MPDKNTPVRSLADIEAIERTPLAARALPGTTWEALNAGARINPDAPALSFFLRAADFQRPQVWTYRQMIGQIARAANALRGLGIGRQDVVAFVLPNLPETHWVIWGGEAAGIVLAINPMLPSDQIAELLRAGNAKWVVTLEPTPKTDLWDKVSTAAQQVQGLQGILTVGIGPYLRGVAGLAVSATSRLRKLSAGHLKVRSLRKEMARARADGLNFAPPSPGDISSYFCTGGTTGLPKIARRTHASEVFDCWATATVVADAMAAGAALFCGLPLFHVNGQLVTGLAPWMQGAHVVLGTPQGYRGESVIANFWKIAEHYRIAGFSGVPTVYSALLQVPVQGRDLSSLVYGFCGAAPMPEELFRRFEAAGPENP